MALLTAPQDASTQIVLAEESDYGSDLDEATVDALLSQSESQAAIDSIETPAILDDHGDNRPLARLAKIRDNLTAAITGLDQASQELRPKGPGRSESIEIEYDETNRRTFSRESIRPEMLVEKLTR